MKKPRRYALLALLPLGIALAGAPAFAHEDEEDCKPEMMNQAVPASPVSDRSAAMAQRLGKIKTEIGITAEQEGAWKTFTDKIRQQQDSMKEFREAMQRNPPSLAARNQMRTGMQERMAVHARELASALTPEQKAVLEKHFGTGGS